MTIHLLLMYCLTGYSQNYVQMLNSYSEWHVTTCFSGCITDKYYSIGDTVINNLHYTFLDKFHYNKNFVIREDTIQRKVYMRLLSEPSTVKEYLLYNFSLNVNDTMSVTNPGSPFPKYAGSFLVDSIKLKPVVAGSRRFFYLHSLDTMASGTKNTIWIEGIGSLCLINTPGAPPQINGAGQLSCFFNAGINHYQNLDSIANCIPVYPTVLNENKAQEQIKIFSNYDERSVTILDDQTKNLFIRLYNINGQQLYSRHFSNKEQKTINLENISSGILFLQIETEDKQFGNFKIINP